MKAREPFFPLLTPTHREQILRQTITELETELDAAKLQQVNRERAIEAVSKRWPCWSNVMVTEIVDAVRRA